ncbi:protein FAR-RED IMPAIRED RESPONSE 1-like [Camellia sinensis]|uniref:protein FAR-RED IMPAIRED RESPONSE 1-like n=1 Tax=Camellia sinensis TaxID=4442 RepID=UPI0010367D41|nr:protein FAR-RED IMPAIRED RESPONSE 1-like [Camellia sinensis]
MDYGQFGNVVTFDTTFKLNSTHRPFAFFVGFNHHRETAIFGAALMYDEITDSFVWLFRRFLEAMSSKASKTIFMDQDAAMAKAILAVMPNTKHHLCTWHLMQNALRHANSTFKDKEVKDKGMKSVLSKFMYNIEDENEFMLKWKEMLDKYEEQDNHWLKLTFGIKENGAGHMLEMPGDEYVKSLEVNIEETEHDGESTVYTILDSNDVKVRKTKVECDGSLTCNCRKKFGMKGILCSHCLKILRDTFKFKEILSQYILKRWTKKTLAENVKDRCGHDIKVDARLHQTSHYRSLMAMFRAIACKASESEETYNLTVEKAVELIANIESMLSAKFNMPFSNTIEQESPPDTCSKSFEVDGVADTNPSFLRHNIPFSMPLMYSVHGSYQALLNNASGYDSQASNSPACSQVLCGHGRGRGCGRGRGHGHVDHMSIS